MKLSAEQKKLFDALSKQQQLFATHVIQGESATAAYKASGYTAKTEKTAGVCASKLLGNAKVAAFIDSVRETQVSDAIMSQQEVLETLSVLGRTSLSDVLEWRTVELGEDDAGRPLKQSVWSIPDSIMQDPKAMSAIAEVSATKDGIKIKQHSRLDAMKQICAILGYEAAKKQEIDLSNSDKSLAPQTLDASKLSTAALKELAKAMNDTESEADEG